MPRRRRDDDEDESRANRVHVDLRSVLALQPEERVKWLNQAFRAAEDGHTSIFMLYDTITNIKFVDDLPHNIGNKLAKIVNKKLDLFSTMQQRFLTSEECQLLRKFGRDEEPQRGNDPPDAAAKMEEMMARCRAFAQNKAEERKVEEKSLEKQILEATMVASSSSGMEVQALPAHPPGAEQMALHQALEAEQARREAAERKRREREMADAELARIHEQTMAEAEGHSRQKQIEAEVDNSLELLERLGAKKRSPTPEQAQSIVPTAPSGFRSPLRNANGAAKRGSRGWSRSRSISASAKRRASEDNRNRGGARPRSTSRTNRRRSFEDRGGDRIPRRLMYNEGASGHRMPRRLMYQSGGSRAVHDPAPSGRNRSRSRRRRSNSRSSRSDSEEKRKEALRKRMQQWEKEERVQRDFFGWTAS